LSTIASLIRNNIGSIESHFFHRFSEPVFIPSDSSDPLPQSILHSFGEVPNPWDWIVLLGSSPLLGQDIGTHAWIPSFTHFISWIIMIAIFLGYLISALQNAFSQLSPDTSYLDRVVSMARLSLALLGVISSLNCYWFS